MNKLLPLFFSLFAMVSAEHGYAAVYTTYNAFAGGAVDQIVTQDTFSDLRLGTILPTGAVRNGIGYQFSTSVGTNAYIDGTSADFSGQFLTTARGASFQPGDKVTFTFDTPINSFGLNFYSANRTLFQLITNEIIPQSANISTSMWDQGTSYFVGLVSDSPFTSITFSGGYQYQGRAGLMPYSGWTISRVVYGVASVPLPSSIWLLTSAIAALITFNRRKENPTRLV